MGFACLLVNEDMEKRWKLLFGVQGSVMFSVKKRIGTGWLGVFFWGEGGGGRGRYGGPLLPSRLRTRKCK